MSCPTATAFEIVLYAVVATANALIGSIMALSPAQVNLLSTVFKFFRFFIMC